MSTLVAQTISNGTVSTSTANVINGAKAWVNFNGTGTVAIRGSYNVSSITDHATGNYTVNFTNSMPNVNYSVQAFTGTNTSIVGRAFQNTSRAFPATGSIAIGTVDSTSTFTDIEYIYVAVFGS
jgi:hypothetical protein